MSREAFPLRADLHLHTTASDGQLTPPELVRVARQHKLDVIAVTDHDTTAGIAEGQQAASGSPLLIPGVELSAEDGGQDVHVLGYYVRVGDAEFQARLARFRDDRYNRARRIVERLAALDAPVAWERVLELANGGAIGRPHVARALVEAGHVGSLNEAFDRYLYTGGPAYVARQRLSPEEAVALIHDAGGVAVLAHPALVEGYREIVERLVAAGLDGVEVFHPQNPFDVRANLKALALQHHLVMTGGSDFHRPGDPIGSENPPAACVGDLRRRAEQYR